jgi:predicted CDP-diglyceride synthetase/phosphatidate cytidylyltransferase
LAGIYKHKCFKVSSNARVFPSNALRKLGNLRQTQLIARGIFTQGLNCATAKSMCGSISSARSAVKPRLGAKGRDAMIEDYGSVMNRMDSVNFAAPIFFRGTLYLFTP